MAQYITFRGPLDDIRQNINLKGFIPILNISIRWHNDAVDPYLTTIIESEEHANLMSVVFLII